MHRTIRTLQYALVAAATVGLIAVVPSTTAGAVAPLSLYCGKQLLPDGGRGWCSGTGTWRLVVDCKYGFTHQGDWITNDAESKSDEYHGCWFGPNSVALEFAS